MLGLAFILGLGCGGEAQSQGSRNGTSQGGNAGTWSSVVGGQGSAIAGGSSVVSGMRSGGASNTGGTVSSGGATNGDTANSGGYATATSAAVTGGANSTGGKLAVGGTSILTGGTSNGGARPSGGASTTGGTLATGGAQVTGGHAASGGTLATGGIPSTGGTLAIGGSSATGGYRPTAVCSGMKKTLGSQTPSQEASMQRMAVTDTNCKKYVVQNNNFGNPTGSIQVLDVADNTATVMASNVIAPTGRTAIPASFPSMYVGANGDIAGGAFSTWTDSGLPKRIALLSSVATSLSASVDALDGDYNIVIDAWFAKSAPTAGGYDAAVSGSLRVWLYQPAGRDPNGSIVRTASIAQHLWTVWVGQHGTTSKGTDDSNRPIVSYVLKDASLKSLSFNLVDFFTDAIVNADSDMIAGKTSQELSADWFLTDVIGGHQIWTGADAVNLKWQFSCAVH